MLKPIPEDTGSFLAIRTAKPQMLYVDKTAYLHRLVTSSRKCLFLARPRRFGKSLMITTLKEIFNGRKDLFEGLAIAQTDYEWKNHPVLHFHFGQCANATGYENFARSFAARIEAILAEVGCGYDRDKDPADEDEDRRCAASGRSLLRVRLAQGLRAPSGRMRVVCDEFAGEVGI